MKSLFILTGAFSLFASSGAVAHAQNAPSPQLRFVYVTPTDNDAFSGCGGVVGVDVSLQGCTTLAPNADEIVWSLEFQPVPALRIAGLTIPFVPEISMQRVVPHEDYMYFLDREERVVDATVQSSLRFAIGYDSFFYDRHLWGNRALLKIGAACLLTRPLDLNARREGCDDLDLDNWFVKGLYAKTIRVRRDEGYQDIGYVQASVYWEMPDHDFATKVDTSGIVDAYNDDGMHVTYADITLWAKSPLLRFQALPGVLDLRIGGGGGLARQVETATSFHADILATLTPSHNFSISAGAKYTGRTGSFSGSKEDNAYWTAQAFAQWRPDFVVFWDHRS